MEQRAITQMEKSKKMTKAEEKFRQAQAVYDQAVKDEKERVRRIQDRHKYMMGGCVLKYFPEGFNACLRQAKGEATLPLRRAGHAYPTQYFASDEALKSRTSSSTKSALPSYHNRHLLKCRKVRCRHGY